MFPYSSRAPLNTAHRPPPLSASPGPGASSLPLLSSPSPSSSLPPLPLPLSSLSMGRKGRGREGERGDGGRRPHVALLVLAYHPIKFFVGHARIFWVMDPLSPFLGFLSDWTLAYSVFCELGVPWTFQKSKEAP